MSDKVPQGYDVTEGRSIRFVIEHALTEYYDGNAEMARVLIDRLLAEDRTTDKKKTEAGR